ncbi:MAG TPA: DMT family transporter [Novosphingobium sp.]|nr:DMT family transporter [Novosphingobium sp.]
MRQNERAGLLYALAGFATLSFGDAVIKTMAGMWSPVAIAALRFSLAAVGLAALLGWREGRAGFQLAQPWAQFGRGAALAVSSTVFFTSLFVLPLATATAIGFTTPMFTAILAAVLLGEPLRRATLIASAVAFAGVLVVLRPNLAEAGLWAVLPIFSAITFSLLIIGNRHVAGTASALAMQFWVATFAAPVLLLAAPLFAQTGVERFALGWPDWTVVARCAFVAVSATCAHWLIYLGTTRAGAAVVAPATYIQLLVATFLGWLWFDTHPDAMTLLGAGIIIGSGLYLWREGQVREPPESE